MPAPARTRAGPSADALTALACTRLLPACTLLRAAIMVAAVVVCR
jgi:hypothetical protein